MITLEQAQVSYGPVVALAGLDLRLEPGEWLALIGPSGSGKTSALRAIAGFEPLSGGRVSIGGALVAGVSTHRPPEKRGVGFVFQGFALFPHLTVRGNVAFGLPRRPRAERDRKVQAALEVVEMAELADRHPSALSGGQQQRVALARALAPAPKILLMDEPFGSLDPALRARVRGRVVERLRARGCTVVFISHDLGEALAIADRVALLRDGHLEQLDTPEALYLRPRTAFAAGFTGPVELLDGVADGEQIETALGPLPLVRPTEGPARAVIRPHMVRWLESSATEGAVIEVIERVFTGPVVQVRVKLGDRLLALEVPPGHPARVGQTARIAVEGPVETVPV